MTSEPMAASTRASGMPVPTTLYQSPSAMKYSGGWYKYGCAAKPASVLAWSKS